MGKFKIVPLSKEYADNEKEDSNTPKVISQKIKASELGWDGNDLNEFSYNPKNEVGSEVTTPTKEEIEAFFKLHLE